MFHFSSRKLSAEPVDDWSLYWPSSPAASTPRYEGETLPFASLCDLILEGAGKELSIQGQVLDTRFIDTRAERNKWNQFRVVQSATSKQREAIERAMIEDRSLDRAIGALVGMQVSSRRLLRIGKNAMLMHLVYFCRSVTHAERLSSFCM
jgi:hypothetical protein